MSPILIGKFGSRAIMKRSKAFRAFLLIGKSLLVNTGLFWEKGTPKAIPTMCVLTIKKDKNILPLWANSCILVLGNHADPVWSKSDWFALVLRSHLLDFLSKSVLAIHHEWQPSPRTVAPATAQVSPSNGNSPFMRVLASFFFFRTLTNILHLSSAGRRILWRLHGFVPSSLI